ncbi:MAG: homoserine dehydrogenase [Anaerolineales bacterium]|nr:homoserine dehydrogenase [Anaerolineales bacterium]
MNTKSLIMLGFGNVGKVFAQLLLKKQADLQKMYNLELQVVGIGTGSHGFAYDPAGINLTEALEALEAGKSLDTFSAGDPPANPLELLHTCQADVLIETTPVNYQTGEPGLSHIESALKKGMHAVTANKGPVVHGYRRLTNLAEQKNCKFYFESTVMDGAPVFGVCRECLPGSRITSFRGVLNSTTNLILNEMENNRSFEDAVRYAQSIGIAETDPSGDVDGWDASIKVAALVTVLMNSPLTPAQVNRTGIREITLEQVQQSVLQGKRWKLLCEARKDGDTLEALVRPLQLTPDDPLYHLDGTSSAITFHSDTLGPLTLREDAPGPETTAYGLLTDTLNALGYSFTAF